MTRPDESAAGEETAQEAISAEELELRVIYSLMGPAVRLASHFELPLKVMKEWLGVAYLHELKRRGLTQQQSAALIDVSRRTIIGLTKRLRENFFEPERHDGLRRRMVFLLWAEPLTEGRLRQVLLAEGWEEAELHATLTALEEEDVITREASGASLPLVKLRQGAFRLYRESWIARIDALNHQLDHIADAVFGRFFAGVTHSFVRTVTVSVRREDVAELERLYREVIFPALVRLDAAAAEADAADVEQMELNISWSPKDLLRHAWRSPEANTLTSSLARRDSETNPQHEDGERDDEDDDDGHADA